MKTLEKLVLIIGIGSVLQVGGSMTNLIPVVVPLTLAYTGLGLFMGFFGPRFLKSEG